MISVRVYHLTKLKGTRTCFSADDVPEAVASVMVEEKLEHCAARFEDEDKSGGWMLISNQDKSISGLLDIPPKKRPQV